LWKFDKNQRKIYKKSKILELGKIEQPHRTLANMVHAMLLSAGLPPNLRCYAVESSAYVYRYTYHSALDKYPMRLGTVLNRMLTNLAYGVVMFTFSIQIPRSWITELFMVISLAL
jgi:hypothetical protein